MDLAIIISITLITLLLLCVGVFLFIKIFLHKKNKVPVAFDKTLLMITLPKEGARSASEEKRYDPKYIKELISVAESFFSTVGGMKAQRGKNALLKGRSDHFSLEIVALDGLISFYISVPKYMQEYIQQMILSQYPEAHIQQVDDYNIFSPRGVTMGCHMLGVKEYIFPLKTYLKMDGDPLNAITNSLGKIPVGDGAVIQIVARSAKKEWHRWGYKTAEDLQKGKKINDAVGLNAPGFSIVKLSQWFSSGKKREKDNQKEKNQTSPVTLNQEVIKGLEEKTAKAGLDTNIRIIVSAKDRMSAERYLNNISDAFSQYNYYQYGNTLKAKAVLNMDSIAKDFIFRNFDPSKNVLLNTEEIASIFHFPTPLSETPNIRWLLAKRLPAPVNTPQQGIILGENIFQGQTKNIQILDDDRRRHMYIVGMTGTGKSTLMENMATQDIRAGKGVCVIDPHGTLIENILPCIPKERADDVILFDASDTERPFGLNILEADTAQQQDIAIQEMIAIFYKLVTDPSMIGPMFEHNMRNAMFTLMADKEDPGTLADIPRIFTDPAFQKYKVQKVSDPLVRSFWEKEMAKTSDFHKSEMLGYLISKVGRFVENAMMRNIIGQNKSSFDLREIMDNQKILLVNLSKGKIGEINSNLLGLIIVSKLQMAALARADMPEAQRKDFYLYIDEFQNFITDSVAIILAEARKYKLNLILAHQYLGQLSGGGMEGKAGNSKIRDAIFGNVGTLVSFRIGVEDSEVIAKQFAPNVSEYDLMNIEKFNAYIRLLINNQAAKPFSLRCFPPVKGNPQLGEAIRSLSRLKYGRNKDLVEDNILKHFKTTSPSTVSINPISEKTL